MRCSPAAWHHAYTAARTLATARVTWQAGVGSNTDGPTGGGAGGTRGVASSAATAPLPPPQLSRWNRAASWAMITGSASQSSGKSGKERARAPSVRRTFLPHAPRAGCNAVACAASGSVPTATSGLPPVRRFLRGLQGCILPAQARGYRGYGPPRMRPDNTRVLAIECWPGCCNHERWDRVGKQGAPVQRRQQSRAVPST
jgi:hypothetical protein